MTSRAFFRAGVVLCYLFAAGHTAGFVQASLAARRDPTMADLTRMMRATGSTVGGMRASILDYREYFSVAFSLLLVLAMLLAQYAVAAGGDRLISGVSLRLAAGMIVLLCASAWYGVFQGVVSCALIAALFIAAWVRGQA